MRDENNIKYWSLSADEVMGYLQSNPNGLTDEEAILRLKKYGENLIEKQKVATPVKLFIGQFKNPIIIILIIATSISAATGSWIDSVIISGIIIASVFLSFFQEYSASNAIEELRDSIHIKSLVLRNGKSKEINSNEIVPGDILLLSAGALIPADGLIIENIDFLVNQSVLTGESLPSEKSVCIVPEDASIEERINCIYMGTNVHIGSAKALVVKTGENTEFGQIADHLKDVQPETDFEKGVRHFGYLLTQLMLILTLAVFAINVLFHRPAIDSLLFSVALAVGLTPQLLPAIISITLSKGSKIMAEEGVIVRRLSSIENFGSMDILCTDKTGTLTEGTVHMDDAVNVEGIHSEAVFNLAYVNANLQTGLVNPLDQAILNYKEANINNFKKINEIPYDFTRKRLSVIVSENEQNIMITKGALNHILEVCSKVQVGSEIKLLDNLMLKSIEEHYSNWSNKGIRVLGIAKKPVTFKERYSIEDETEMTFTGFLLFFDPPKADVEHTIKKLKENGVELRIITGDNKLVAVHTAEAVGIKVNNVLTGADIMKLNREVLWNAAESANVFAEVDPNQKELIILALKKKNHVVGYMGDGINDVPALHAADIGISVDSAVDVAKQSANFVLVEKSLDVLNKGIELGRTTFANTLKYITITISANFGNMFSMAGASLFMPFLPLLPKQILLINFLTDFPALTIANDAVDTEAVKIPRKWDIKFIRDFMFIFGIISSLFDYIAFAVLLLVFKADQMLFQTSWFLLSIITELLILMIMRTQRPFFKSKPSPMLLYSTIAVGIVTILIIYLPINNIFDFEPIPFGILVQLMVIASIYIIASETAKYYFYRRQNYMRIKPVSKK